MISSVALTQSEVNLILIMLGAILAVIGYIGRQQVKWMNRIESKVNDHSVDLAVIKAVMGIDKSTHHHDTQTHSE